MYVLEHIIWGERSPNRLVMLAHHGVLLSGLNVPSLGFAFFTRLSQKTLQ